MANLNNCGIIPTGISSIGTVTSTSTTGVYTIGTGIANSFTKTRKNPTETVKVCKNCGSNRFKIELTSYTSEIVENLSDYRTLDDPILNDLVELTVCCGCNETIRNQDDVMGEQEWLLKAGYKEISQGE